MSSDSNKSPIWVDLDLTHNPTPPRWLTLSDQTINTDHIVNIRWDFLPTGESVPRHIIRVYLTDDSVVEVYYNSPDGRALRVWFGYDAA